VINGAVALIEVRDVSRADALSMVVAHARLTDVTVRPGDRVPSSSTVPEVSDAQSLEVRIHIASSERSIVKTGDLLTTASHRVPSRGMPGHITIPVKRI
jgi:hypothetical protein